MTGPTKSSPDHPPRPGFLRRWSRRAWRTFKWLTLLLLIAAIGYIAWTNHRGRVAVERVIAEMKQRDIPAGVKAWEQRRRGVSDEQMAEHGWVSRFVDPAENGALTYESAYVLANRVDGTQSDLPFIGFAHPPQPCEKIHPQLLRDMDALLDRHAVVFDLIAQARAATHHDYPVDPTRVLVIPEHSVLTGLKSIERLLRLQCLHAQAHGDTEQVTQSLTAIFDLATTMNDEPGSTTRLVQMNLVANGWDAVEDALSRVELTAAQVQQLEDRLRRRLASDVITPAIESDLAVNHNWLAVLGPLEMLHQVHTTWQHVFEVQTKAREAIGLETLTSPTVGERWVDQAVVLWAGLCPGWFELAYVEHVDALLTQHGQWQAGDNTNSALRAFDDLWRETWGEDAAMGAYPLVRTRLQERAVCAAAVAALAVERYRLEHGRWPAELSDVAVPLPEDPYTGRPLVMRRTDDGIVIYSVGRNGEDNSGRRIDPDHTDASLGDDDWDFRLYDPQMRNSKAAVHRTREDAEREFEQQWREMLGN